MNTTTRCPFTLLLTYPFLVCCDLGVRTRGGCAWCGLGVGVMRGNPVSVNLSLAKWDAEESSVNPPQIHTRLLVQRRRSDRLLFSCCANICRIISTYLARVSERSARGLIETPLIPGWRGIEASYRGRLPRAPSGAPLLS